MTFVHREQLTQEHAALVEGFKRDCRLRRITTYDHYSRVVIRFLFWLEENRLDPLKLTKADLKSYLLYLRETKGLIHKSLEGEFARLGTFYSYLADEELIDFNPIPDFKKRNIRAYKSGSESQQRQVISVMDAAKLVSSVLETRDRSIILLLLKTGIRNHELCELDVSDLDLDKLTITVKPASKRSNRELYIDHETADCLRLWLSVRSNRKGADGPALFLTQQGNRVSHDQVQRVTEKYAARVGLHDSSSNKLENRFTPHCCRHWYTTHLIRAGMPRDFVKELRGDTRREAVDIYNHIDKKELKESYLACIPQLGL